MDAPFGIARDDVRDILRQCHAKVCARDTSAGVDNLFGGDASLHFHSCTFQGWTPRNSSKNPPAPTEVDDTIELDGEKNRTLNYENLNEGKHMGMETCGDKKSTVTRDDKTNVPSTA